MALGLIPICIEVVVTISFPGGLFLYLRFLFSFNVRTAVAFVLYVRITIGTGVVTASIH